VNRGVKITALNLGRILRSVRCSADPSIRFSAALHLKLCYEKNNAKFNHGLSADPSNAQRDRSIAQIGR